MPHAAPQSIPAKEATVAEHITATAHELLDAMTATSPQRRTADTAPEPHSAGSEW